MKDIKLNSLIAGPNGVWHPGKHSVSDEFAASLVAGKFAEYAVISPAEKAVVRPQEKAVVKPPEITQVNTSTQQVKPPVAAPASSVASNKAATWGTPKAGG